jgi:hypothetical protein
VSTLEKFLTGVVGVGLVTTLVLPKRQTPAVVSAFGTALSRVLSTVMGTSAPKAG